MQNNGFRVPKQPLLRYQTIVLDIRQRTLALVSTIVDSSVNVRRHQCQRTVTYVQTPALGYANLGFGMSKGKV